MQLQTAVLEGARKKSEIVQQLTQISANMKGDPRTIARFQMWQ